VLSVDITHPLRSFDLDVRLEVQAGHCLAVAGPSGAGKTTLLRAIAGLLEPRRGRIACGQTTWLDTKTRIAVPAEERRCGLLLQHGALFPHLTAAENVGYGLPRTTRNAEAHHLLARFDIEHLAHVHPHQLSGGERQRVALARALAVEPPALLLDEPLAGLDARTRVHVRDELAATIEAAGVPALLVTHDIHDAAALADEVAVLDAGRIVQRGTTADLTAAPASAFVADFLRR
jgi:molybdate transport system ATP-binding protein